VKFSKYHALGNDYIVIPTTETGTLGEGIIRLICDRHYGIGSDGILFGPLESASSDFLLRIFNPDGSEAEKSGNGLRIFSRFLRDQGLVADQPFSVETSGGEVICTVGRSGEIITVEMGEVKFDSALIPVSGPQREVINETITINGQEMIYSAATIGNPHCVILHDHPSQEVAESYGPVIEKEPRFPNRTNVQFMKVLDRKNIMIEIWERGAGYTLASGSSSTAAAAVTRKLGLCDSQINVHMPGGVLDIQIDNSFRAIMRGPVTKICEGTLCLEAIQGKKKN
jgi:diaminopimelate epimerase